MLDTSDPKKGVKIEIDGAPYLVTEFEFVKPGKGQGLYRCRLRNLLDGSTTERTFRSGDKLESADVSERQLQYLYREGDRYYFMDTETYDQLFISADQVGDARDFLTENLVVAVAFFGNKPIGITLPKFIDVVVTRSGAGFKGDTVSNVTKPVTIETGATIQVPLFIAEGEKIRIDTRTGAYVERVKG